MAGGVFAPVLLGADLGGSAESRYRYAGAWGYETTPEIGAGGVAFPFMHVGHRWYDPETGRFLQRDPIGIAGGLNVYAYVENAPTFTVDPSGLIGSEMGTSWPPDSKKSKEERRGERKAIRKGAGVMSLCIGNPWARLRFGTKVALWLFGWANLL